MTNAVPTITLNSGYDIPQLGFGVYQIPSAETERAVAEALEVGFRHFDTAAVYGNEAAVGAALAASGIDREELFVTTKLWNTEQGLEKPLAAVDASLAQLGLDYIDLYLMHFPAPARGTYVDSWRAMERIAASGKARSIGVSNFLEEHLDDILEIGTIVPAVNQIELHPAFQQRPLREYGESRGIRTESWGPLGQNKYPLAELPGIGALADKHGKSVQQIAIRWQLQEGIIVFPKTLSKERMASNFDVLDFELDDEDMTTLKAMDAGRRVGVHPLDGNW